LLRLCCTDLIDFISDVDEKTKEDLQHSLSDNSRRLIQTSDSRTQSVYMYLSDHVRVDTSNQRDADVDCKQSYSACDLEMHVETGEQLFECAVCSTKFKCNSALKSHMHVHAGEQMFRCEVCSKAFISSISLKHHICAVYMFACKLCSRKCKCARELNVHLRTHIDAPPFRCKVCNERFRCDTGLKRHMRNHVAERHFRCEVCKEMFKNSKSLNYHMRIHKGGRRYSCGYCDETFAEASHLTSHLYHHTEDKPFSCSVCHKKFTNSDTLRNHMNLHTVERPVNCKVCKKWFKNKNRLKCHMRTDVHRRLLQSCANRRQSEVCCKKFKFARNLKKHLRSHTEERTFTCKVCNKMFTGKRREGLKDHMRHMHKTEQTFTCKACYKMFKRHSSFLLHMHTECHRRLVQTSDSRTQSVYLSDTRHKPFSCSVCGKKCTTLDLFRIHMSIHRDKRPSKKSFNNRIILRRLMHSEVHRRPIQTSNSRTQSVYLNDHVRVDTSNQLDTDDDCKQSYSACDTTEMHVDSGDDRFICYTCNKKFTFTSELETHMHIHTGFTPYSCTVCHEKFTDSSFLTSHMQHSFNSSLKSSHANSDG